MGKQNRSKTRTTTTGTHTAEPKQVPDFYIFESAGDRQEDGMERETEFEPATSSLGKRSYFVY
jgi:hypothetical protein